MDAKIGSFFESIGNFFTGGDQIPWCDRDVIAINFEVSAMISESSREVIVAFETRGCQEGCEREVAEASNGDSEERKNESIMRLSWALVHSRKKEDVQRGIAMLETSLGNDNSPLHQREKIYLLAVGYYRSNDYGRSRELVGQCLEIAPDWRQAQSLKKIVEDRIAKDGVIGIGITATGVALVVGGIAAALARKN